LIYLMKTSAFSFVQCAAFYQFHAGRPPVYRVTAFSRWLLAQSACFDVIWTNCLPMSASLRKTSVSRFPFLHFAQLFGLFCWYAAVFCSDDLRLLSLSVSRQFFISPDAEKTCFLLFYQSVETLFHLSPNRFGKLNWSSVFATLLSGFPFCVAFAVFWKLLLNYPVLQIPLYPDLIWCPWPLIFLCCIVRNWLITDPENITALFLFRFGKHCCFLLLLIRIDVNATNCSASLSIPDYPACLSGETDCVLLQTPIFIWVWSSSSDYPANNLNHETIPDFLFQLASDRSNRSGSQAVNHLHKLHLSPKIRDYHLI